MSKFIWYAMAVLFPFIAQSSYVISYIIPGIDSGFFLYLSVFIIMMQVGQAAFFQSLIRRHFEVKLSVKSFIIISSSAFIFFIAAILVARGGGGVFCSGMLGVINGSVFSILNSHLMIHGGESAYFKRLFYRNLVIISFIYAPIVFFNNSDILIFLFSASIVTVLLSIPLFYRSLYGCGDLLSRSESRAAVFGIAASSIYRNDQNFVRSFSLGSSNFIQIHNSLLAGSVFQSLIGAVMSTLLIPRIKSNKIKRKLMLAVDLILISFFLLASLLAFSLNSDLSYLIFGSVILGLGQWFSFKCHFHGFSTAVYILGVFSALSLYFGMYFDFKPALAFFCYSIFNFLSLILISRVVNYREAT